MLLMLFKSDAGVAPPGTVLYQRAIRGLLQGLDEWWISYQR